MKHYIHTYLKINEYDLNDFLKKNKINMKNVTNEQYYKVSDYVISKFPQPKCFDPYLDYHVYYEYDKELDFHMVHQSFRCDWVMNREPKINRYGLKLESEGQKLPRCLNRLLVLTTPEDAVKISTELINHFSGDRVLMEYANWLEFTSKSAYKYDFVC